MIGFGLEEALAVDTCEAVARWWTRRRPSAEAPIPDGLVEDLQTARVALDDSLQRRLWDLATILKEPQRAEDFTNRIAELDPWQVLGEMLRTRIRCDLPLAEQVEVDHQELIAALKERAWRRERLRRPPFPSAWRRRLRDLARGRGGLAAVLKDDDACRMLRFGLFLCDLIEVHVGAEAELDLDEVRAVLSELAEADARRAAEALLNDPLVGADDRGRPVESEVLEFVRAVVDAVQRRVGRRLTPTITRAAAGSADRRDVPGPDIQLVLDLLACHLPAKEGEAVADLIKEA